jgi:predicted nucleotidyltransferase
MATIRLPPDFREFLQLLNAHEVEYLLVGGWAVGYHGYPRATVDMDLWIGRGPANAEKMVTVLREFGFDTPNLSKDLFLKEDQIVRMGVPPIRLEIFTSIPGVQFEECYCERIIDELDGMRVNLLNLEHLKASKRASGRNKDLNDLENLP